MVDNDRQAALEEMEAALQEKRVLYTLGDSEGKVLESIRERHEVHCWLGREPFSSTETCESLTRSNTPEAEFRVHDIMVAKDRLGVELLIAEGSIRVTGYTEGKNILGNMTGFRSVRARLYIPRGAPVPTPAFFVLGELVHE